ncbi:FUSC family protein [Pseudomonas panipatensis]|uniref:Fusaric acid resistance protein family protein n=1 Tax=Pseudomonas panipatensis TaxID=428992 RepID=A0A1G8IJX9_9PSED|nr:FUSC family protein [Pseudomonas panipatensis]SDI19081.1 Fusaric acid resistance protein family protein [Pseudomonas panipatensis]SMP73745.1 Fusaric acid resistance protein family protein [Pseudomonas panipatensis]
MPRSSPWQALTLPFRRLANPYSRYRYAAWIHCARVGLALLASMLLTSGIDLPHGLWASVTVMVVMGGLVHQGTIRGKSYERILGTLLGAAVGLGVVVAHDLTGSYALIYLLMALFGAVAAYFAIGRAGYVALLAGITLFIVAGHGDNGINEGLWRTLNVLLGVALALLFAQIYPLRAVYVWRYLLSDNLRACARLYGQLSSNSDVRAEHFAEQLEELDRRLVAARAHLAPVARETAMPVRDLELIQRTHRAIMGTLESLIASRQFAAQGGDIEPIPASLDAHRQAIVRLLLQCAHALKFSRAARLLQICQSLERLPPRPHNLSESFEKQGFYWLTLRLYEQVERLSRLLAGNAAHWNIQSRDRPPRD